MTFRKQHEKALERLELARDNVYAAAYPRRDVPLSQCLAMASESVKAAYRNARDRVSAIESEAIMAGKAYRNSFGSIIWH